jgi:hypothetical protein
VKGLAATLGIGSLSALASTGRAAADDDFVLEDGDLEYTGTSGVRTASAEPTPIERAVAGLNEARDRGLVTFNRQDGEVYVAPAAENDAVVSLAGGCPGKNGYKNRLTWQGLRHIFHFDDCTTNELRNKLIAGAAVAEIAAVVAGATGNAPAAAVSAIAGILMGAGATLLDVNNDGRGVKFYFHGPNIADIDIFEIEAQ